MGKKDQNSLNIGVCLIFLAWGVIGSAVWIYYRLGVAEQTGINFRFNWFFYLIYKIGGREVASIAIGICGLAIFILGLRKVL